MSELFDKKLQQADSIIKAGLDAPAAAEILRIIGGPDLPLEILEQVMLYNDTLPKAAEAPYTTHQRYLHFMPVQPSCPELP